MVDVKTRPLVDIAADVLADESQRIGISYTGFCLTSLPHKRLPDEQTWEKKGHRVTLWVEPGRMKSGRDTRGQSTGNSQSGICNSPPPTWRHEPVSAGTAHTARIVCPPPA